MIDVTFTTRSTNRYSVSWLEQLRLGDGVVYFGLKYVEKTILAYLLACLWSLENSTSFVAKRTISWRHGGSGSKSCLLFRSPRRHKDNCTWASSASF